MTIKTNPIKIISIIRSTESFSKGSVFYFLFFASMWCFLGCNQTKPEENSSSAAMEEIKECYFSNPGKRDSLRRSINKLPLDTIKADLLFSLSYHYYKERDSSEFRYWNDHTFQLSEELRDTLLLAESNWDLANFYVQFEETDSAFYHYQLAANFYSKMKNDFYAARMQLNMGILQQNVKDYTGSEITTAKAIEILKPFNKQKQLYIGYNSLGITLNELGEYNKALRYHEKAYQSALLMSDTISMANTLNNIGVVYEHLAEYDKAIGHYMEALEVKNLLKRNPELFAMLQDNLAYSYLELNGGEDREIESRLLKALRIRDSIDHRAGIVVNKIHLAQYYMIQGDSLKAREFLIQAKSMAMEDQNYDNILKALLLLSQVDKDKSEFHLTSYINIGDSLQVEERRIRNKFARIKFETNEFIVENEYLVQQRKWLIGGSSGVILILVLLFVIRNQKAHNKELQLEQAQQKANEEIYNLLFEQEKRIEEGRTSEKLRISQDLHDGVLSRLFGTRFALSNLIQKKDGHPWEEQLKLLNEFRLIEAEIRNISHDLNNTSVPDQVSFLAIVEKLLEDQKDIGNFSFSVKVKDQIEWQEIANPVKINLYRIIQEAIQNINKYSLATEVLLSFEQSGTMLIMTVSDNGRGFDTRANSPGIGLNNMKKRAISLNGICTIFSDETGTVIKIEIPL